MKVEELINLKIPADGLFLSKSSLQELVDDVKQLHSTDWWKKTTERKLEDCNNDKARILKSLINILETEYEAPVIIKYDQDDAETEDIDKTDEDLDDFDSEKK